MNIRQRNVALCIVLTIVTCGLYSLYWMYCLHQDVSTLSNTQTSAGKAILLMLLTCGIYMFFWMYQQGKLIEQKRHGSQAVVYLILSIFGLSLVSLAIMQSDVNQLA